MSRFGETARAIARWAPPGLVRSFGRPAVLLFHGVEPTPCDTRIEPQQHSAEIFSAVAKSLKANFDVLPLSALDDALAHPTRHTRTVFLTSDDGYANTLSCAADILAALALPWTLFISTHHIDTGARNPMFLARLFFFLASDGRYDIPHFPVPIELGRERGAVAAHGLAHLKGLASNCANQALAAMSAVVAKDSDGLIARYKSERFLTWAEVATLKQRGVEIGAHAHIHWAMHCGQSASFLREQANRPRVLIESRIGPCHYFAYPFGNVGDLSPAGWRAVCDAGYSHAFTTLSGALGTGMNPFLLPRFEIGPRETRLASLVPLLRTGNLRVRLKQDALV